MKTGLALGVSLSFLVCALVGCEPAPPTSPTAPVQGTGAVAEKPAGKKKLLIAVIPKGEAHEFWKSVRAGALQKGKELSTDDVEIEVTFKGPSEENNIAEQASVVENFIADHYDGICLAPTDAVALRKPVDAAIAEKIPVVIFDSGLKDLKGVVSFVATDNYQGGQKGAELLAKAMGDQGNVILLRYMRGSASTDAREEGFLDEIKKHPNIKVLVDNKEAGASESGAKELSENLLQDYKDKVNGIFCSNQSTTSGMLTALIQSFPEVLKNVKFVGFDSGTNIADALENGQMEAAVLQDPVTMGGLTVETMVHHLQGKKVKDNIPVAGAEARQDNLKSPEIQQLLRPVQAK